MHNVQSPCFRCLKPGSLYSTHTCFRTVAASGRCVAITSTSTSSSSSSSSTPPKQGEGHRQQQQQKQQTQHEASHSANKQATIRDDGSQQQLSQPKRPQGSKPRSPSPGLQPDSSSDKSTSRRSFSTGRSSSTATSSKAAAAGTPRLKARKPGSTSSSGSTQPASHDGSKQASSRDGGSQQQPSKPKQGSKPSNQRSPSPRVQQPASSSKSSSKSRSSPSSSPSSTRSSPSRRPSTSSTSSASSTRSTRSSSSDLVISTKLDPFLNIRFKTFEQLQHLVRSQGSAARIADLAAMMSRLKQLPEVAARDKAELLRQLWQLLQPQLGRAAGRHCAEAMLTASKLGHSPDGLYAACLEQFVLQVQDCDARILANALYAVATAPKGSVPPASQQQLEEVLLPQLLQRAPSLPADSSQSVSNSAYALALLEQSSPSAGRRQQQLQQLLRAVQPSLWAGASMQEVSNTTWSAGLLGAQLPGPHLDALLGRMLSSLPQSAPQDISNTVYGLTLLQHQLPVVQHEQLLSALLTKAPDAQSISNVLWCTAKMGLPLRQDQADAFVARLLESGRALPPQSISLSLWSIATAELSIAQSPLVRLLQQLAASPPEPQALSVSLWAAAKMGVEVPSALLGQLYQQLAAVAEQADPQALSNALWAAAMQPLPYFPEALLPPPPPREQKQQKQQKQQKLDPKQRGGKQPGQAGRGQGRVVQQQRRAAPAARVVAAKVAVMKPLELSSVALALALLGCRRMDILEPVYDAAMQHLQQHTAAASCASSSSSSSGSQPGSPDPRLPSAPSGSDGGDAIGALSSQACSNLCWAGAILDLRHRQQQLRALAQASAASWVPGEAVRDEEALQLYQLHLWLTELVGVEGLEGVLTPAQLQECRRSMAAVVAAVARPSQLQQVVWEVAQRLPGLRDARLEAVTEDGLLSVDIVALWAGQGSGDGDDDVGGGVTQAAASGPDSPPPGGSEGGSDEGRAPSGDSTTSSSSSSLKRVAIEVDGPWHYRRPDHKPTGSTLFRDKLLAARGFLVVNVPYFKWQSVPAGAREGYLQDAIVAAAAAAAGSKAADAQL